LRHALSHREHLDRWLVAPGTNLQAHRAVSDPHGLGEGQCSGRLPVHQNLGARWLTGDLDLADGRPDASQHALELDAVLVNPGIARGGQRLDQVLLRLQPVTERHLDQTQLRRGPSDGRQVVRLAHQRQRHAVLTLAAKLVRLLDQRLYLCRLRGEHSRTGHAHDREHQDDLPARQQNCAPSHDGGEAIT
jgi:hypothetical protein